MLINLSVIVCRALRYALADHTNETDIHYALGRVDAAKSLLSSSVYYDMDFDDMKLFNELFDELLENKNEPQAPSL